MPSSVLLTIASSDEETIAASKAAAASTPRCVAALLAMRGAESRRRRVALLSGRIGTLCWKTLRLPEERRLCHQYGCGRNRICLVQQKRRHRVGLRKSHYLGHQFHPFASSGIAPLRCGRTTQNRCPVGAPITHQVFILFDSFRSKPLESCYFRLDVVGLDVEVNAACVRDLL